MDILLFGLCPTLRDIGFRVEPEIQPLKKERSQRKRRAGRRRRQRRVAYPTN